MTDRALLDLLLDDTPGIIALVVRDGRVMRRSKAAGELLRAEHEQPIDRLFDPASRRKLAAAVTASPTSCELQARIADELVAVRVALIPLAPGEHLMLLAQIGADYAEAMTRQLLAANDHLANLTRDLARQSAELDGARRRFESLADMREHFISMLAHDVRGALQSVLLGSEAIERAQGDAPEPVRRSLERIRRSAVRVTELVDKVLEAARTESGRMVLDARPVAMRDVVNDAVELYGPIAERAGLSLELIDHAQADQVSGDRVRLGQVTGNLIENAIRHSPRNSTITVELTSDARVIRVAVRDRGPGIPPEVRERIFERFVQGPVSMGSLGLGLYVAHQVVELHHGRIYVEDVVPHGAALIVELPRAAS